FPPTGLFLALSLARCANRLKQTDGLDVIEMEESFGAARYAQQMVDTPIVLRLHGPHFLNVPALGLPVDPLIVEAERRCIADAESITSPSLDVLDRVRERYELALPDAVVIPNPVPAVSPERRWRLDACDGKTILFVGRFDRHKGGDLVIDAFRAIATRLPQTELIFVGPDRGLQVGSGETSKRQMLGEYLDEHVPPALRSRMHILGPLPGTRIEELRRQAYVTVVASRYENFPLALAEALSFGCPTIAANVGGIPEIIMSERTGLLFAGGDAADLGEKLVAMFGNPDRAARFGQEASADMAARLSPDVVARTTAEHYRALASRPARPRRRAPALAALYALSR
ncbi:MAG: hypothetical protein JWM82_4250, partial [Myxococcales bacterium]|nr:hypothetical protein [Myxococcales bacterium]